MARLIVSEFVTLDGVMEAPGGEPGHPHAGWVIDYSGDEQLQWKLDEVLEAESLLLGRVTYEGFAAAWPDRDGEFADKMNSMPKYVVSSTLTEPLEWEDSTLLSGDVVAEVAKLKEETEGPILVVGSASLVQTLLDADLVDELRLMLFPVLVGGGKRVFPDNRNKLHLRLEHTQTFLSGVVVQTYVREPAA